MKLFIETFCIILFRDFIFFREISSLMILFFIFISVGTQFFKDFDSMESVNVINRKHVRDANALPRDNESIESLIPGTADANNRRLNDFDDNQPSGFDDGNDERVCNLADGLDSASDQGNIG